jgi:hypothetical protein
MPRDTLLPDGSYGALDGQGLADWIEAHRAHCSQGLKDGRHWVKPVPFQMLARVMRHGLRADGEAIKSGRLARRPDCVYLHWPDSSAAMEEWEWGAHHHYVRVAVPVTAVDPRRLLPDEDAFNREQFDPPIVDPTDFGVPHCGRRWSSAGAWADAVGLGSQPGTVEASLEWTGRVAVRGVIAPTDLRVLLWSSSDWRYHLGRPITHYAPDQLRALVLAVEDDSGR